MVTKVHFAQIWIGGSQNTPTIIEKQYDCIESDKMLMIEKKSGTKRFLKDNLMKCKTLWKNDGSSSFISYNIHYLIQDKERAHQLLSEAVKMSFDQITYNYNILKKAFDKWETTKK